MFESPLTKAIDISGKVFRAPERDLEDLLVIARTLDVATIAAALPEPHGRDMVVPGATLPRIVGNSTVAGFAVTVWQAPGTNTMVRSGLMAAGSGDILVIACPSSTNAAQWGEQASTAAIFRGIEAVVIDGSVRDVDRARHLGFPIWATHVDPREALKTEFGYVNGPLKLCGVPVEAGDLVVADADGVLVLPRLLARWAIERGKARAAEEDAGRGARRQGEPVPAKFDTARIEEMGMTWLEYTNGAT